MATVTAALVSPRTIPFAAPIVFLGFAVAALVRGRREDFKPAMSYGALTVAAFLGLALLSALWAERPLNSLSTALSAIVIFLACGFTARAALKEPRRNMLHIAEGFWIGLMVGVAYLLVEILSHQAIKLNLYNAIGATPHMLRPPSFFIWEGKRLVYISPADLTRNIAPITPFLWAALLSMAGVLPARTMRIWCGLLFALTTAVVMLSEHETSKLALIGSTVIFLIARQSPVLGERLLRFAWVGVCLATIPIALSLHRLNLQEASWVQKTAQHRIVIWNYTAEEALKSPILGIGAGMMYEMLGPTPEKETEQDTGATFTRKEPHAHNVYLQTWFELGAVGAALLALVGLAVLERMRSLGDRTAPYAQATFAAAAIVAASSYGMWQSWFMAMFALTVVVFAIGVRANDRSSEALAVGDG